MSSTIRGYLPEEIQIVEIEKARQRKKYAGEAHLSGAVIGRLEPFWA
jgi:hypothetical protein